MFLNLQNTIFTVKEKIFLFFLSIPSIQELLKKMYFSIKFCHEDTIISREITSCKEDKYWAPSVTTLLCL